MEWPYWDDLHGFWSELPNYNPVGVSTSTAGQNFGAHAAALFTKPSDNKEDRTHVSDTQSNHGSGIPDLDSVDLGSDTRSQDWNLDLLERGFPATQDGGDSGGVSPSPDSGEDDNKEPKVCLHFVFLVADRRCDTHQQEPVLSVAQLPQHTTTASQSPSHTPTPQHALISQSTSRSSTPVRTSKDDTRGKSSKNQAHTTTKRSVRDAFHEDIHMLELKEAAERRSQKNAIRLKELELQEKKHAAKVRKMEMDAEIQKAHLNMLNNMANMFSSGSMGTIGGNQAINHAGSLGSGPSTQLDESTTIESWVHSQQASTSSSSSNQPESAFPGPVTYSSRRPNDSESEFNVSSPYDFHFPS
jgi:hypothetical protein